MLASCLLIREISTPRLFIRQVEVDDKEATALNRTNAQEVGGVNIEGA